MPERIGLQAVLEDANYVRGSQNYIKSNTAMVQATEKTAGALDKSQKEIDKAAKAWEQAQKKIATTATVIGASLTAVVTSMMLVAARNQELGVVLETVGANVGKTADEMKGYEEGVKAMGITTQASRQALIQMAQADIDLAQATDLARLAQDAAVIAQMDSSAALEQLITGTQRGSLVMLRQLGINVQFQDAYEKTAEALGKTTEQLTDQERQQARVNTVLEAGKNIAGTYEAAMGTAGKQLRSMNRHVQELADEFAQALLPAMSAGVEGATGILKAMRKLPEPIKATLAQLGGLVGILASTGGAAALAAPKIIGVATALKALMLTPVGAIAAVAAGIIALIIHLKNVEAAQEADAAATAAASLNYGEYRLKLREAGIEARALSEDIYELAKAQQESGDPEVFAKMKSAQKDLSSAMADFSESLNLTTSGLEGMSKAELEAEATARGVSVQRLEAAKSTENFAMAQLEAVAATDEYAAKIIMETDYLRELTNAYDLTDDQANALITRLKEKAQTHLLNLDAIRKETSVQNDYDDSLGLTVEELAKLVGEHKAAAAAAAEEGTQLELTKEQVDALTDAYQKAQEMMEGFSSALTSGITGLQDLDQEAVDSAQAYEDALADLDKKAASVYEGIETKFKASLPDATSVAERLEMTSDAWDEWALRLQDIINQGIASPWYEVLQEMGYEKPPDIGVKEWAADMLEAFRGGELFELINQNADAWKENAAKVAEAQAEQTAKVSEEVAKRKEKIKEEKDALIAAREEQLAAEQAARDRAMLEMALDLAEQSSLLKEWSEQTFGPSFATVADSAQEVLGLLDSGILSLDGSLGTLVENMASGINEVLGDTQAQAKENEQAASEMFRGIEEEAAKSAEEAKKVMDIKSLLPPEDAKAAAESLGTSISDGLESGLEDNPFAVLLNHFDGAKEAILENSGLITEAMNSIPDVEAEISQRGGQATLELIEEVTDALEYLQSIANVNVNITGEYDGEGLADTGSPKLKIEHALERVVEYTKTHFPIVLEFEMEERKTGEGGFNLDDLLQRLQESGGVDRLSAFSDSVKNAVEALNAVLNVASGLTDKVATRFKDSIIKLIKVINEADVHLRAGIGGREGQPLGDLFDAIQKITEAFDALAARTEIGPDKAQQFKADLFAILDAFLDVANKYEHVTATSKTFAERLSFVATALKISVEAVAGLAEYGGIGAESIEAFAFDMAYIVSMMSQIADQFDEEGMAAAVRFAASAGVIGSSVGDAAGGLAELRDFGGIAQRSLVAFERDLPQVVALMVRIADEFDKEGVEAAELFSQSVGKITGVVGQSAADLSSLAEYAGADSRSIWKMARDLTDVLLAMQWVADSASGVDIAALATFAESMSTVAGGVSDTLRAMEGIAEYRGGIGKGMEAFRSDILLLVDAFEDLRNAIPDWLVPGSKTPLQVGIEGVDMSMKQLAATTMLPFQARPQTLQQTIGVSFGDAYINNQMDFDIYKQQVLQVVRDAVRP